MDFETKNLEKIKIGNLLVCNTAAAQLRHSCGTAAVWHLKISKIEEVNARLGDSKTQNPQIGT